MSSFLSASNIFLIVILLDPPPPSVFAIAFSIRTGALGNTFSVLIQLKIFFINSSQFRIRNVLYGIIPQNRCLIRWRLLLSGFRSVLVNATDKPLRLKVRFVSRALVPSDRPTCTIASRVSFFTTKPSVVARYKQTNQCNQLFFQYS